MQLYIEGHNRRRGYAVGRTYTASEIRATQPSREAEEPVRFYSNLRYARSVVERFNRMACRRAASE